MDTHHQLVPVYPPDPNAASRCTLLEANLVPPHMGSLSFVNQEIGGMLPDDEGSA